jgi:hypothetical protein
MENNVNNHVRVGDVFELKTQDARYSRSAFLKYADKTFGNSDNASMNGEYLIDNVIVRFKNGFLHGGTDFVSEPQPAVILPDNHTEWWDMGRLHRNDGPAVVSKFGDWEEFWTHGTLILIRSKDPVTMGPET